MATLYIAEFKEILGNQNEWVQIANLPAIKEQTVSITGTSAQSSAFDPNTRFIRISTDVACHVLVGSNPTATTSKLRIPIDGTEYFGVTAGHKIAVILGA